MTKREVIGGHIAMLGANVIWGLMSPIGKEALNSEDISPLTLTGLRIIGAAVLFWAGSFMLPKSVAPKEKVDRSDWLPMLFAALLITLANQMCIIIGVSMTSPIDATMMCSTTPFFTLILVWALWKVKHHWAKIAGVVVGFAGMLVFILGSGENSEMNVTNPLLGDTFCIMSQVFGAVYMVKYAYLTKKYHPFTLMKWLFTYSAVIMVFVSGRGILETRWTVIPANVILEAAYVVVCGTFLAYVLLPIGQRVMMPTSIAMYNYLQPVVSAVFSVVMGVAALSFTTVTGSVLILAGVAVVNKKWGKSSNPASGRGG